MFFMFIGIVVPSQNQVEVVGMLDLNLIYLFLVGGPEHGDRIGCEEAVKPHGVPGRSRPVAPPAAADNTRSNHDADQCGERHHRHGTENRAVTPGVPLKFLDSR